MDNKKEKKQSTFMEYIPFYIMALIAAPAGGYAARHVYYLIMEGKYFGNAGLGNCIFLVVLGGVGLNLGALSVLTCFAEAKLNPIQWIFLLFPTIGILGGYASIAYVVCNYLCFFGETIWKLGIFVCVLGLLIIWKFVLHEIFYCLLFCWLPFKLRPVPYNGRIAFHMYSRIVNSEREKIKNAGSVYALKCAQRASSFYGKKLEKSKPDADNFYHYYSTVEFIVRSYWEGTIVKRDAAKAISYAENALEMSTQLSYMYMDDTDEDNYRSAIEAKREIPILYFIPLYEIVAKAYSTGDGVTKDEKRAKDAYTKLAALNIKKHLRQLDKNEEAVSQTQADEVAETSEEAPSAFDFPYLITDDWNRQWILDWNNGEEARYTLDPNFDQKTDATDSLSDGVAYLKKADMLSRHAAYMGRTFRW